MKLKDRHLKFICIDNSKLQNYHLINNSLGYKEAMSFGKTSLPPARSI